MIIDDGRRSYLIRILRSIAPYLLFYALLLTFWSAWRVPYGWAAPLPILVIGFFKILPGARYEVRELTRDGGQVTIRYADRNKEHVRTVEKALLQASLSPDPSTVHLHFVLDIAGPGIRVRQYSGVRWSAERMKEVVVQLS